MVTESALTTKMVAGDLGLMMVIRGRTKTAKENPDLLTAKKKRVAGDLSPMVTGNQDPMTTTVKENQKDLQKK